MNPTTKRASRFARQPVKGRNGVRQPVMNDRWKAVLLFIARNRAVSFQDVHNHFTGDEKSLRTVLRVLKGLCYIKVCDEDIRQKNCFRPLHYEIDDAGIVFLKKEELLTSTPGRARIGLFNHTLLSTHATTSIEAGIKDKPHATLLPWDALQEIVPEETLKHKYPFGIPCTLDGQSTHAYADSPPFGIRLEFPDHFKTRYFPGIEADTGSKNTTQMEEQISKYLDIEANQQYVAHFGFKKHAFYVPFLIDNHYQHQTSRIEWLTKIILKLTSGHGSKIILLKEYEPDASLGYILTTDWKRAGHAPFNLLK